MGDPNMLLSTVFKHSHDFHVFDQEAKNAEMEMQNRKTHIWPQRPVVISCCC